MRRPRRRLAIATLFATTALAQAQESAPAPDAEPTAEETATLCWINRFRRDPAAFADVHSPDSWRLLAAARRELLAAQ